MTTSPYPVRTNAHHLSSKRLAHLHKPRALRTIRRGKGYTAQGATVKALCGEIVSPGASTRADRYAPKDHEERCPDCLRAQAFLP